MLSNISYKVTVFSDFSEASSEPETVIELLQLFKDYRMMPAVAGNFPVINNSLPKFAFSMDEQRIKVAIYENRLDVWGISDLESGYEEQDVQNITDVAGDIAGKVLGKYNQKGIRLAVFKEFMYFKVPEDDLNQFICQRFNLIPYYCDMNVVDCNSRIVARENIAFSEEMNELCNIITMANRISFPYFDGQQQGILDGVKIDFDLNTYQENRTPRFEKNEIKLFSNGMNEKSKVLIKQMMGE